MAQKYETKFIGLNRTTSTSLWTGYTASGSQIVEQTNVTTLRNEVIVNNSDGNQKLYNEMTILNFISFDETYTPVTGDLTYVNTFIGLVKGAGESTWSLYKGTAQDVEFSSDKTTFLATLRQAYGDGKFRMFQEIVQSHSHSFVLVP